MAHELGHNLGMDHDENVQGCHCPAPSGTGGCIMASSIRCVPEFVGRVDKEGAQMPAPEGTVPLPAVPGFHGCSAAAAVPIWRPSWMGPRRTVWPMFPTPAGWWVAPHVGTTLWNQGSSVTVAPHRYAPTPGSGRGKEPGLFSQAWGQLLKSPPRPAGTPAAMPPPANWLKEPSVPMVPAAMPARSVKDPVLVSTGQWVSGWVDGLRL